MQSAEYPDLKFMPPRAWGKGRDGKAVRYIVVHFTAGAERSTSAEDGAVYDQRRTDGTSTHYFVDSNSVVQCVRTEDRANAARKRGNRLGIQYEFCGTAQTRAQWLDPASLATLKNAARQMARDCRKYKISVRRLTVTQTRRMWTEFPDGPDEGFVGHVDCTLAYPEDGGDHTDPGKDFPWDVLLGFVASEMTKEEGDDMAFKDEKIPVTSTTGKELFEPDKPEGTEVNAATVLQLSAIWARRGAAEIAEVSGRLDAIEADIAAIKAAVVPAE